MRTLITLVLAFTNTITMAQKKEITTEIKINASPEKVWSILTDFDTYGEWNPFITSIEGDARVGGRIKAHIGNMTFKPTILAFDENQEFRWIGRLFFKGLFDGEHKFALIKNEDGTTTFRQSEKFNGLMVGIFPKKLYVDTTNGFNEMNRQLKERAEK